MPPVLRKQGRPKGVEKTVIGLPCKKSKKRCTPVPFLKKYSTDRGKGIGRLYIIVMSCTTLSYYFMPSSTMVYFNNHFGLLVITIFFFLLVMLLWFVDSEVAEAALKGNKVVEECGVEIHPNRVPASC